MSHRPFPDRERAPHQMQRQLLEQPAGEYEPQPLHPAPVPGQRLADDLRAFGAALKRAQPNGRDLAARWPAVFRQPLVRVPSAPKSTEETT